MYLCYQTGVKQDHKDWSPTSARADTVHAVEREIRQANDKGEAPHAEALHLASTSTSRTINMFVHYILCC